MERQMLRLMLVLGVLVTILGTTGVFATFEDQARGGSNSVSSGARPSAADLQIAVATMSNGVITCQTYGEDTTTPQFSVANFQPTSAPVNGYVCLRNNGAGALTLSVIAGSLTDIDTLCTGDEIAAGDTACGNGAPGELSSVLVVSADEVSCSNSAVISDDGAALQTVATQPLDVGIQALAANRFMCVRFEIKYLPEATETQIQIAQSDQATWNFVFKATAS
jgi:hypothetical protein